LCSVKIRDLSVGTKLDYRVSASRNWRFKGAYQLRLRQSRCR